MQKLVVCPFFVQEIRIAFPKFEVSNCCSSCEKCKTNSILKKLSTDTVVIMCLHETLDYSYQCKLHLLDQCWELFLSSQEIYKLQKEGAHLFTSKMVNSWQETFRNWGFDQATAKMFFQESTKELVVLDIYNLTNITTLQELSKYLDIPFRYINIPEKTLKLNLEIIISKM